MIFGSGSKFWQFKPSEHFVSWNHEPFEGKDYQLKGDLKKIRTQILSRSSETYSGWFFPRDSQPTFWRCGGCLGREIHISSTPSRSKRVVIWSYFGFQSAWFFDRGNSAHMGGAITGLLIGVLLRWLFFFVGVFFFVTKGHVKIVEWWECYESCSSSNDVFCFLLFYIADAN